MEDTAAALTAGAAATAEGAAAGMAAARAAAMKADTAADAAADVAVEDTRMPTASRPRPTREGSSRSARSRLHELMVCPFSQIL